MELGNYLGARTHRRNEMVQGGVQPGHPALRPGNPVYSLDIHTRHPKSIEGCPDNLDIQTILPIELGFSFFVHAHSR